MAVVVSEGHLTLIRGVVAVAVHYLLSSVVQYNFSAEVAVIVHIQNAMVATDDHHILDAGSTVVAVCGEYTAELWVLAVYT